MLVLGRGPMEINIFQIIVLSDIIAAVLTYSYLFLYLNIWALPVWATICFGFATAVFITVIVVIYLTALGMRHCPPRSWDIRLSGIWEK